MSRNLITVDGNEAAASVAFRVSEAIAIYPITPSSPMAELCDEWASRGKTNIWGVAPEIAEMQSKGGARYRLARRRLRSPRLRACS
jgi:pyruvate-ferredoxin/flavodoxin oxidoreductase